VVLGSGGGRSRARDPENSRVRFASVACALVMCVGVNTRVCVHGRIYLLSKYIPCILQNIAKAVYIFCSLQSSFDR